MNKKNIDKKFSIYLTISIIVVIFSILAFGVYKLESSMAAIDYTTWICRCAETGGGTGFANENACRATCETYGGGFVSFEEPPSSGTTVSCEKGEYLKANATTCSECTAGHYCPTKTTYTVSNSAQGIYICPAGKYAGKGSESCTSCPAGKYTSVEGSEFCTSCPAGKYSSSTGATSCSSCTGNTFTSTTGQSSCLTCKDGSTANSAHTACEWTANCVCNNTDAHPGETYAISGAYITESSCRSACTNLGGVFVAFNAPGPVTCAAGKYLPANSVTCEDCLKGYSCSGGSYTPKTSASGLIACTGNTYADVKGLSSCKTCSGTVNSDHTACTSSGSGSGSGSGSTVPVTGVSIQNDRRTTWKLGIGEQITLTAVVSPSNATNKNISRWTTNNVSAATISSTSGSNTVVTGVSEGEATITATTEDQEKKVVSRITVVGSSTTAQIMAARLEASKKKLINATESNIHKDQDIDKDSNGNLVYPFGLGCIIGEDKCFDDVIYSNRETSMVDETGKSITLTEIKNKWNNDPYLSGRWNVNYMNNGEATIAVDKIKGKYSATYKNVNKSGIDVKATIVDFEPMQDQRYMISQPAIVITNKKMGVAVTGIKWVKIEYKFIDPTTNTTISKKGNTTYWEVDENQGVIINSDGTNKGIFFVNHGLKYNNLTAKTVDTNVANQLYYKNVSDGIYIFDHNTGLDQTKTNPLYNDLLNSVSYAFTEEFEGDSITRTFQYSNPVFKNQVDERVWNGHGGVFISSTPVRNDRQYYITTEVENGEIFSSSPIAYEGDTVTITYSPNEGYELSYIEVDSERIDITDQNKDKYVFENINADHHIKVVYEKSSNSSNVPSPKTGIFEVGGVLIAVLAIGGIAYFLTKKKQISNKYKQLSISQLFFVLLNNL